MDILNNLEWPIITWNLFLTAFLVPVSVSFSSWWIVRFLKKKDKEQTEKEEQIKVLLAEKEVGKENDLKEWREQFWSELKAVKIAIDELINRVGVANGRTYKLEKEQAIQKQHCIDQHLHIHSRAGDNFDVEEAPHV